eukprot:scaffold3056_cov378-Prasinococcus_capsulatus_cf.AAC.1
MRDHRQVIGRRNAVICVLPAWDGPPKPKGCGTVAQAQLTDTSMGTRGQVAWLFAYLTGMSRRTGYPGPFCYSSPPVRQHHVLQFSSTYSSCARTPIGEQPRSCSLYTDLVRGDCATDLPRKLGRVVLIKPLGVLSQDCLEPSTAKRGQQTHPRLSGYTHDCPPATRIAGRTGGTCAKDASTPDPTSRTV